MQRYHIAKKGKKAGRAVPCPAKKRCKIMPLEEHLDTAAALEHNNAHDTKIQEELKKEFGQFSSVSKNLDFSVDKSHGNFRKSNEPNIAKLQESLHRYLITSDSVVNERDRLAWAGSKDETDITRFDSALQELALRRMNKAARSEVEITASLLSTIQGVKGVRADGLPFRLKSPASITRKIKSQSDKVSLGAVDPVAMESIYQEVADDIKDAVRYTIVSENHDKIGDLISMNVNRMRKLGYEVVDAEHSYVEGNSYMDARVIWRHPKTGENFEVQYHSPVSLIAKNQSHEIYEKLRVSTDAKKVQDLTKESAAIWSSMKIPSTLANIERLTGIKFAVAIRA